MSMGRLARAWDQPSAVLLVAQLGGVLLFPFMEATPLGRAALSTVGLAILFLAVRAVRATPALGRLPFASAIERATRLRSISASG